METGSTRGCRFLVLGLLIIRSSPVGPASRRQITLKGTGPGDRSGQPVLPCPDPTTLQRGDGVQ